jgi:hypothetical protein
MLRGPSASGDLVQVLGRRGFISLATRSTRVQEKHCKRYTQSKKTVETDVEILVRICSRWHRQPNIHEKGKVFSEPVRSARSLRNQAFYSCSSERSAASNSKTAVLTSFTGRHASPAAFKSVPRCQNADIILSLCGNSLMCGIGRARNSIM